MSEAYLIAATQGNVSSFSSLSHAGQVEPILQTLFEKSGVPPRRIREIHWHGGDEEFWLSSLGQTLGFAPDLARFQWPTVPLLAHSALQNIARSIEDGEADLVLLAQETAGQAVVLLLASPGAVGVYNLSPKARIGQKLALSSAPNGLLKAACVALNKVDRESAEQDAEPPGAVNMQWLASAKRLDAPSAEEIFPGARWVKPGEETPPGDLFLLRALVTRLEEEKAQRGLLLSEGPQKSGLVTLVERI